MNAQKKKQKAGVGLNILVIDKIIDQAFRKVIEESNDDVLKSLFRKYKEITDNYIPDRRADAFAYEENEALRKKIRERLATLHKPALISLLVLSINTMNTVEAQGARKTTQSIASQRKINQFLKTSKNYAEKNIRQKEKLKADTQKLLDDMKNTNAISQKTPIRDSRLKRTVQMQEMTEKMNKSIADRELAINESKKTFDKMSIKVDKVIDEMKSMGLKNDFIKLIEDDKELRGKIFQE